MLSLSGTFVPWDNGEHRPVAMVYLLRRSCFIRALCDAWGVRSTPTVVHYLGLIPVTFMLSHGAWHAGQHRELLSLSLASAAELQLP